MSTDQTVTPFAAAPSATIPSVLASYGELYTERPCLVDHDRELTVQEFTAVCAQLRAGYAALGLRRGDPVGILLPNGWRWVAAAVSLASAGLVVVPLSTWYRETELASAQQKTGLRAVITQNRILGADTMGMLQNAGLGAADVKVDYLGPILWSGEDLPAGMSPLSSAEAAPVEPHDPALYVFTSGSSASPKVVVLLHEHLMRNGDAIGERMGVQPGDSVWYAQPLFFALGCANAMMMCLTRGATLCVEERFDPWESPRFIQEQRCTVAYVRGLMVQRMVEAGSLDHFDTSSLRRGAVSLSPAEKQACVEVLGLDLACSAYGLTETHGYATMTSPGDALDVVTGTQGTALPTQEVRCWDTVADEQLRGGSGDHLGEIQVRGACTPGYFRDPAATAASMTPDGWFRTGDLGWLDDAGRLHFAGRSKEVIKVHGITVSPAEVEGYVREHPDVIDAWAFGWSTPDSPGEETLCCAVVVRGPETRDGEALAVDLRTWLRARISSYKVPGRFVALAVEDIPLTATGKVSKRLIGEQFFSSPA